MSRSTAASCLFLVLAACGTPEDTCLVGSEQSRTELFFGLGRVNAPPVSDAEFQSFLDTAVTPRFPAGLTLLPTAHGQYTLDNGDLVRENSKVLILIHEGGAARSAAIDAIREEYNQRFEQESVLRIDSSSCVSF